MSGVWYEVGGRRYEISWESEREREREKERAEPSKMNQICNTSPVRCRSLDSVVYGVYGTIKVLGNTLSIYLGR